MLAPVPDADLTIIAVEDLVMVIVVRRVKPQKVARNPINPSISLTKKKQFDFRKRMKDHEIRLHWKRMGEKTGGRYAQSQQYEKGVYHLGKV